MSTVSESLRRQVTARAGNCCEYCHLPAVSQVGRFPVDHVIPRSSGGLTDLTNLALACPACNGHKWAHVTAFDPVTGEAVPLFNPRTQGWSDHFQWSEHSPVILEGKTAIGRATVIALQMNQEEVQLVRTLLLRLGIPLEPGAAARLD
jgi:hypothetical protein